MKNIIRKFISFFLLKIFKIDPDSILYFAYYTHNIRPGHDFKKNGELYLIKKIRAFFSDKNEIVVFDVGANDGSYSKLISDNIQNSKIYAFEPNFELIQRSNYFSAKIFPIGLGDKKDSIKLFINEASLEEATLYEEASSYLRKEDYAISKQKVLNVEIDLLDNFCKDNGIEEIDFLKIDTEGHEYFVLNGAKEMLKKNKIKIIQFEFNEMNVFSRVFLKDYYELLSDNFEIFRLHKKDLYPLKNYHAHNEIFVWQNLIAINKKIVEDFKKL